MDDLPDTDEVRLWQSPDQVTDVDHLLHVHELVVALLLLVVPLTLLLGVPELSGYLVHVLLNLLDTSLELYLLLLCDQVLEEGSDLSH